jgi:hypothetical protein
MPLGGFGFLSLFYAFLGIRFAYQFWPRRKAIFDRQFTEHDRSMVTQAAFFFLLPLSVALHELGHALAIWGLGGEVLDFGFYFFAGYVSYDPRGFSNADQMIIAFAGTAMNIVLIVIAMGLVLFRNPPLRAPYNELLLQFSVISGINAFILYPLLDYASNMSGDWTQMYEGGVPTLTAAIVAIQLAMIGGGVWLSRNPSMRKRLSERTGMGGRDRGLFGWSTQAQTNTQSRPGKGRAPDRGTEQLLTNAAGRVASGWAHPIEGSLARTPGGTAMALRWNQDGATRAVIIHSSLDGRTTIRGGSVPDTAPEFPADVPTRSSWGSLPTEDDLTMALRLAMEDVDQESPAAVRG